MLNLIQHSRPHTMPFCGIHFAVAHTQESHCILIAPPLYTRTLSSIPLHCRHLVPIPAQAQDHCKIESDLNQPAHLQK